MRKDIVVSWLAREGQSLSDKQLEQMARYQEMVHNAPMNLTAIKTDEDFAIKHFIDSLTLLPWVDRLCEGASFIDIGTGAGFPGVPIKIARPGLRVTLLDSLQKRILFLRGAVEALGLEDVECIHARAEDFGKESTARGRGGTRNDIGAHIDMVFDLAAARAVASLDKLVEYAMPLVKPGGAFLAMKGPDVEVEVTAAKPMLHKYGAEIEGIDTVDISQVMGRTIITIRKLK